MCNVKYEYVVILIIRRFFENKPRKTLCKTTIRKEHLQANPTIFSKGLSLIEGGFIS